MDTDKKIQERIILNHFRKHFPEFPKGRIIPSESPDFLLKLSPKKSIGIELAALPGLSYNIQDKIDYQNFISHIHQIISRKEEKITRYRKKLANAYWLILYVDSIQPAGFNFNTNGEKIQTGSRFDRVFLFDLFEGKIYLHK